MSAVEQSSSSPDVSRPGRPISGLEYYVARTLQEVEEAWELVYHAYRRQGLIDENPHGVHTTPSAIGPNTAVVLGCLGPLPVGTLSVYKDGAKGLPLDSVYPAELNALRQSGRKLMEVGLFADRREHMNRAADGLFSLMRYCYFFGLATACDDAVVGVHPRHAPFYLRLLGFERIGPVRSYATVHDNPVILLRLKLREIRQADPLPKGIAFLLEQPLAAKMFDHRFRFEPSQIADSRLGRFLVERYGDAALVA